MTDPSSNRPPVIVALERNKNMRHNAERGESEECSSLNLRVDWRFLVIALVLISGFAALDPELVKKLAISTWNLLTKHFL